MTSLNSIIEINISRETTPVSRASFGIPCFISEHTAFAERARVYSDIEGVEEDFPSTSNAWKAANKFFSQEIVPEQIVIGRRQVDTVTGSIATVANSTLYRLTVQGETVSYTSDSSATALEIVAGLKSAFDIADPAGVAMTDNADGTFTLGAAPAGTGFSVSATTNVSLTNSPATETWSDTISAVQEENDAWYGLATEAHTQDGIEAISAVIEAKKKIYGASTDDANVLTSSTSDVASNLKALGHVRTFILWNEGEANFPECAVLGRLLPEVPGSVDWIYKNLSGVAASALTSSQVTYAKNKNVMLYEEVGGVSATTNGDMVGGEKIDIMIGVDWTEARMRENIWFRMVNAKKVPYTTAGTTIIETEIRKVLSEGIRNGLYADSPAPVVTMPAVLAQDANDRANRIYRGITFEARLAGAIRFVKIRGTVTV